MLHGIQKTHILKVHLPRIVVHKRGVCDVQDDRQLIGSLTCEACMSPKSRIAEAHLGASCLHGVPPEDSEGYNYCDNPLAMSAPTRSG